MEKKFEDDELNRFLDKELMKEAELIEQALFSDDSFEDYEETDEELNASYQRLVERLKADGIYRDDDEYTDGSDTHGRDESDKENDESGGSHSIDTIMAKEPASKVTAMPVSDKTKEKRKAGKTHKIAKAAGFVVVGTLCVFAASMTSEANRNYFVKSVRYLVGDDTRIIISNNEDNDKSNVDEYEAKEIIQKSLGIEVPEFMYKPKQFKYLGYEVDTIANIAIMEYTYNNNVISIYIDRKDAYSESGNYSLHGEKVATITIENIKVDILEVKDTQDLDSTYLTQFSRNNTFYQISGKMDKEEYIKLIKQMKY